MKDETESSTIHLILSAGQVYLPNHRGTWRSGPFPTTQILTVWRGQSFCLPLSLPPGSLNVESVDKREASTCHHRRRSSCHPRPGRVWGRAGWGNTAYAGSDPLEKQEHSGVTPKVNVGPIPRHKRPDPTHLWPWSPYWNATEAQRQLCRGGLGPRSTARQWQCPG